MPLAKLFKVMDVDGQYWHIAAASFAEAERKMQEWDKDEDDDDSVEVIQSLEKVEDLILGGTRAESLGNYQLVECAHIPRPKLDYTLENRMAEAGEKLVESIFALPHTSVNISELRNLAETLRAAIEKYNEIPF